MICRTSADGECPLQTSSRDSSRCGNGLCRSSGSHFVEPDRVISSISLSMLSDVASWRGGNSLKVARCSPTSVKVMLPIPLCSWLRSARSRRLIVGFERILPERRNATSWDRTHCGYPAAPISSSTGCGRPHVAPGSRGSRTAGHHEGLPGAAFATSPRRIACRSSRISPWRAALGIFAGACRRVIGLLRTTARKRASASSPDK